MNEQIREIAQRIAALREIMEVTEEEMAEATGLTLEAYRQQESGAQDFNFTFLDRAAGRLGVDIADLMSGEEPRLRMFAVTRKGQGPTLERRKEYRYEHLAQGFRNKKGEIFIVNVDNDGREFPTAMYAHEGHEFSYMLEGSMKFFIEDQQTILREGDSIYFDATKRHARVAINCDKARFLTIIMK